jgi:hypothetical protein
MRDVKDRYPREPDTLAHVLARSVAAFCEDDGCLLLVLIIPEGVSVTRIGKYASVVESYLCNWAEIPHAGDTVWYPATYPREYE